MSEVRCALAKTRRAACPAAGSDEVVWCEQARCGSLRGLFVQWRQRNGKVCGVVHAKAKCAVAANAMIFLQVL